MEIANAVSIRPVIRHKPTASAPIAYKVAPIAAEPRSAEQGGEQLSRVGFLFFDFVFFNRAVGLFDTDDESET